MGGRHDAGVADRAPPLRLHVSELIGAVEGDPPVVLLHGLFGQSRNLGVVARGLAAEGQRVLSLDLRNHGQSPHAPDMRYPTMAADVFETLDARGALPAVVIGHSLGGKVAMRLALDAPHSVSRLVVADIAPRPYEPHFRALSEAMAALDLSSLTRASADAALAAAVPGIDAPLRAFLLANAAMGPGGRWRIGLQEIRDALADIEAWPDTAGRTYTGPALALTGARSACVRPSDHALLRALFPTIEFVAVPDAGHWLHADNPAGVTQALARFLARR